jgi:hypothetical protein
VERHRAIMPFAPHLARIRAQERTRLNGRRNARAPSDEGRRPTGPSRWPPVPIGTQPSRSTKVGALLRRMERLGSICADGQPVRMASPARLTGQPRAPELATLAA